MIRKNSDKAIRTLRHRELNSRWENVPQPARSVTPTQVSLSPKSTLALAVISSFIP